MNSEEYAKWMTQYVGKPGPPRTNFLTKFIINYINVIPQGSPEEWIKDPIGSLKKEKFWEDMEYRVELRSNIENIVRDKECTIDELFELQKLHKECAIELKEIFGAEFITRGVQEEKPQEAIDAQLLLTRTISLTEAQYKYLTTSARKYDSFNLVKEGSIEDLLIKRYFQDHVCIHPETDENSLCKVCKKDIVIIPEQKIKY